MAESDHFSSYGVDHLEIGIHGWFRIYSTMVGIVLTDGWVGYQHFLGNQYGKCNKHKDWNLGVVDFAKQTSATILGRHSKCH